MDMKNKNSDFNMWIYYMLWKNQNELILHKTLHAHESQRC